MDDGGLLANEVWADFWDERYDHFHIKGYGARPWILGRRDGLARGIVNRLREDGRMMDRKISEPGALLFKRHVDPRRVACLSEGRYVW